MTKKQFFKGISFLWLFVFVAFSVWFCLHNSNLDGYSNYQSKVITQKVSTISSAKQIEVCRDKKAFNHSLLKDKEDLKYVHNQMICEYQLQDS